MNKGKRIGIRKKTDVLFDRVVTILEQARANVVRTVNTNMVVAYWLIGREIVQEVQGGAERAAYGKQVVEDLSARMTERYGKGFSVTNIWYFKQFYLAFQNRLQIPHPLSGELASVQIPHPLGAELMAGQKTPQQALNCRRGSRRSCPGRITAP